MFYRGFKSGVILYRKADDMIEISEIKCVSVDKKCRWLYLIPIIGNWQVEKVKWFQNSKCFLTVIPWGIPSILIKPFYFAGTNFEKVIKKSSSI
jgi:hypothetical protein